MSTNQAPEKRPAPTFPWILLPFALLLPAALGAYLLWFTPEKQVVRHRLAETDTKSEAAIDTRLKPLTALFEKARKGAKPFAETALSWSGKWALIEGLTDKGVSHRVFLSEAFARHVLDSDELRAALESAVRAFLDDIEGFESEMLVHLRADLANLSGGTEKVSLRHGDKEFREEYQKLSGRVAKELQADLGVTVGREVGMLVATEVVTQVTIQAAKGAAGEMGVSAGLLGSGTASMVGTLGVGLIVSIILDYLVDAIFKAVGYDPAEKIEKLVVESIDKLEAALINDPDFISFSKKGSLRKRMEEIHEARSQVRRETIDRFLKEGDAK